MRILIIQQLFKNSFTITRDNSVIPRYKLDRRHSHFRANIRHQQKSRTSKKKKGNLTRTMLCLSCRTFSRQSINKRSLVCGSGEELAEDPFTLSAMKSRAYAPEFTQAIFLVKKRSHYFFSSYLIYLCNSSRFEIR